MADNIPTKQEKSLNILLSVRGIIIENNGMILLTRRSYESSWNPGRWEVPGGKPKSGENLQECLQNEVFEETGLTVRLIDNYIITNSHIEHEYEKYINHLVIESCGLCKLIGPNRVILNPENCEFIWVNKYEALTYDLTKQSRNAIATFFDKI